MANLLLVDMDKCTGCKQCSLACSLIKEDLFDPYRGRVKVYKKEDIALGIQFLCEQCDTYPCIDSCPENALSRDDETGIITVDESKCTGQGECIEACTYYAIKLHPETNKAIICDLCDGDPYCAKHCVPGAIQWIGATDDLLKQKKKLRSARMAMYRDLKKEAA
ncbi:MAG: 4Fe-4S dicluster domain-containing protein [Candidatus Thorarchaeota archaeon]